MGNDVRTGSGDRTNWPVRLSDRVGAAAEVLLSGLAIGLADFEGFWPQAIKGGVGAGLGMVLGQIAGARVFRLPPGNAPRP